MVMIDTRFSELKKYIGRELTIAELREVLFDFGIELSSAEGDELKIEITAERHDLLSTQGLARALSAFMGVKTGLPLFPVIDFGSSVNIHDLPKEWPYALACVVKGLKFDDEKIKEVIRVQEKIGSTLLRERRKGGLGLYPLDKIKFPIEFTSMRPDKIKFKPLEYPAVITGREILSKHPTGRAYGHLCGNWAVFPVFVDADKTIMSMPPVINSHDVGKITENTKDVFVECTGTELKTLKQALDVMVTTLIDMGGRAYSLKLKYKDKEITYPDFASSEREIDLGFVNNQLGLKLTAKEAAEYLQKMMYGIKAVRAKSITVLIPAIRTDIWHDVDVVDDIARAYGFNNLKLTFPNINTIGAMLPLSAIKDKIADFMISLGFLEIYTFGLSSSDEQYKKMCIKEMSHISLANAADKKINMIRTWLLPEAIKALTYNRHNSYPQKIFEIGHVVVPDEKTDVKSRTVLKMSCMIADSRVTFTQIKQVLDALFAVLGLNSEVKETEHSSFITGRAGEVFVEGRNAGVIGEINPQVLENFGIEVPAAGFEIFVEALLSKGNYNEGHK